jgi:hypothetical protein
MSRERDRDRGRDRDENRQSILVRNLPLDAR